MRGVAKLLGIAVRTASRAPMRTLTRARVSLERGVEDDLRGRPGERQVTVLAREAWDRACAELGAELDWTTRRANLLVEGLDLEQSRGRRIAIGTLVLEVSGETDPCQRMDEQRDGLRAALTPEWRGGASCRVLSPGEISVGDAAGFVEAVAPSPSPR